jgi:endonuclease/exonuclease/phosphatase family metal-dependent hydrolase
MVHLSRLLTSTKAQVCFISETRNSSISAIALKNHFALNNAYVVPSNGHFGGLCLLWTHEVEISILDQSQHYIFCMCINKSNLKQFGLVCVYGDLHHRSTSIIWDNVLTFVASNYNVAMFCMGDLNELMHDSEKLGPRTTSNARINLFQFYVKRCGFIDLGYNGPAYTWTNKCFSFATTYERLDRCLANVEWCMMYPETTVFHLPMMHSDHTPVLTVLNSNYSRPNKPFRFENWWLLDQDFHDVAHNSWRRSSHREFNHKTKFLAQDLKKWRRKKSKNSDLLAHLEQQIFQQQTLHPSVQNHNLQNRLHTQHQDLLAKESAYHVQRYKKTWAFQGDRNTEFCHKAIIKRNRKNEISCLQNPASSYSHKLFHLYFSDQ